MFSNLFTVKKLGQESIAELVTSAMVVTTMCGGTVALAIYLYRPTASTLSLNDRLLDILGAVLILAGFIVGAMVLDHLATKHSEPYRKALWLYSSTNPGDLQNTNEALQGVLKELGRQIMYLMIDHHDDVDSLSEKVHIAHNAVFMLRDGILKREDAIEVTHLIAACYDVPFYVLVKDIL